MQLILSHPSLWAHPLLIPSYLALLSIIVLVAQAIFLSGSVRRLCGKEEPVAALDGESGVAVSATRTRTGFVSAVKDHVETSGGYIIFLFRVSRLLVVLILLGLAIFSFVQERGQQHVSPSPALGVLSKMQAHYGVSLTKREWLNLTLSLTYVRYTNHQYPFGISLLTLRSCMRLSWR